MLVYPGTLAQLARTPQAKPGLLYPALLAAALLLLGVVAWLRLRAR